MVPTDNGENTCEGEESVVNKVKSHAPLHISTSQRARFQRMAEERNQVSCTVPSSSSLHIRERLQRIFSRKIDLNCLWRICKEWIRDPMNLALFVFITCVAVSSAILLMVMTGMLNHAIPKKSQRDAWFEVNNQILNALFTLMCLYQHPKRIYHLALLLRWRPEDVLKLRKVYCKNGTYKPNEWVHMMVVVVLLNVNCFAQYALCGLTVGYKRSERPAIGVGITIAIAIGAPAFAGVHSMLSPLGKDYETEIDKEVRTGDSYDTVEDKFCRKRGEQLPIPPLPREDGEFQLRSSPSSPFRNGPPPSHIMKANSPSPSRFSKEYNSPGRQLSLIEEESCTHGKDETMMPPGPSVIRREEI